jgi:hypothetical protein
MKGRPPTAFVEEVDPKTEEPITGTKNSASFSPPASESREQRKFWRKSGQHVNECQESKCLGPMLETISQHNDPDNLLTIVAGKHPDNEQVWKECETLSKRYRVLFYDGMLLINLSPLIYPNSLKNFHVFPLFIQPLRLP